MKNLNFYKDEAFAFHQSIITSKRATQNDPEIRNRLLALNNGIEKLYKSYKLKFDNNTLELLKPDGYNEQSKIDLLSLYSFKSTIIQKFKKGITTTATNRMINTCQNCTIGEVSSFDHILPKEEFTEFVVNPLNLFPSCSVCNSAKGKYWMRNGQRIFLNLYLDQLPDLQYLFVKVSYADSTFITDFTVKNPNGIDPILFDIIESHYHSLHLTKRFSDYNDKVIPKFQNSLKPYIGKLPLEDIIKTAKETIELNRTFLGHNYWESILELELLNNSNFLDSLNN
jgi:5-methylcytosine-specific restriction endonuclease McrA